MLAKDAELQKVTTSYATHCLAAHGLAAHGLTATIVSNFEEVQ